MKTSIATVSLSGSLTTKLAAIAAAGFDGIEIFEQDLVVSPHTPAQIRQRAAEDGADGPDRVQGVDDRAAESALHLEAVGVLSDVDDGVERAAEEGDFVVIDLKASKDGEIVEGGEAAGEIFVPRLR